MDKFIPLASPDIRDEDIEAVVNVLKSGQLVQGKEVENLEVELSKFLNVPYCVMMANGTSTLQLSLVALGIGRGDEVIVPAFSYMATANVVELVGAKPIFVDIDINTFNINPQLIEEKISSKTKAIMVVHEFGLCADMNLIIDLCESHGLYLIEDAACAIGAKYNSRFAGSFGVAGSFSFHPRKAITSGEGGAVVTFDKSMANKLKTLRNHGIDALKPGVMDFILPGFNFRMTDFQAALLQSQLKRLDFALNRKRDIATRYLNELKNEDLTLPSVQNYSLPSWQTFHILLSNHLNQSAIILKLREFGIGTNYGAQCMPEQTYFKNKYGYNSNKEYPNAFRAFTNGLAIPLYEKLSDDQVTYIIDTINSL